MGDARVRSPNYSGKGNKMQATPIDSFLLEYSNPGTRRQYRQALDDLTLYADGDGWPESLLTLTPDQARGWVYEHMADLALTTRWARLAAARQFYNWARLEGLIESDPFARVRQPQGARVARGRALTPDEAQSLLDAARNSEHPNRDVALVLAGLYCGLRRAELAGLTWGDMGREGETIYLIVRGKGDKERVVKWPDWAKTMLLDLQEIQGHPVASASIFGMTGSGVYQALRRLALGAGIVGISPHDLRRTFITWALDGKAPLERVQEAAGHVSPGTTEIYDKRRRALSDAPVDYIRVQLI